MADLKQTSNGADYTTYQLNPYLKNRLKYHAASRLASQTGEGLSQAMSVDGHTVTTATVWAAPATAFPNNADKDNVDAIDATNDLVTVFKAPVYSKVTETKFAENTTYYTLIDGEYVEAAVTAGETIPEETEYYTSSVVESKDFWAADKSGNKNGKVWTNTAYPAVKLYENVPMTAVKGSDGGGKFQAFEILAAEDGYSEGTLRVSDWVAPTSVADQTTGKVVAGFSGIPMAGGQPLTSNAGKWGAALGTWEFVYIAGMLTFEPGYTPQEIDKNNIDSSTRKSLVSLTAFKYCGEYLADSISGINDTIDTEVANIDKKIEDAVKDLNTNIANAKEIAEVKVVLADGAANPADSGKTISSAVTGGVVTMTINAEVLSVKQGAEEIQPDMVYADGVTTLTADYGTAPVAGTSWTLTYRI